MNARASWLYFLIGPVICAAGCDKGNYTDVESSEKPPILKRADVHQYDGVFFAFPYDEPPPGNSLFLRGEHTVFRQEFPDRVGVPRYTGGKATVAILTQKLLTEHAGTKEYAGGQWSLYLSQQMFLDNATDDKVQVTIDSIDTFTVAAKHHMKVELYLGVHKLKVVNPKDSSVIDERKFLASKEGIAFLVYNVKGYNRYTCIFKGFSN